jgi:hypothetical protein
MSDPSEADGVWIFVSHSNLDLKRVRQIRDALEKDGHKPLLFFLKCLQKDDARLPQLIRDEIKARTWFVLCDSDHSRASPWVQEEVAIVTSTKPKDAFVAIDLANDMDVKEDDDVPPFVRKLRPLLKRATVFLSYAHSDAVIANQIYHALVEQDYRAFAYIQSLKAGMEWRSTIQAGLEDALEHGFVLLLLSPDYLTNIFCKKEREFALKTLGSTPRCNIVPVVVRDPDSVYRQLPLDLSHLQCPDMTKGSIARNITALIRDLKSRPMT